MENRISRRVWLQGAGAIALSFAATPSQPAYAQALPTSQTPNAALTPQQALETLLAGNQRFVQQKRQYPHQNSARLLEVAQSQHPFATILSCADSRVPAEMLFDQGIGDLFDIRVAGNVVTPEVLGSLEYAAVLLKCPLIMVLGHERCGAVTAAVQGEPLPGKIGTFVAAIAPALAADKAKQGDPVEAGVLANVRYQTEQVIQQSPLLAERVQAEQLKVVGARYDLDTGKVTLVT